MPIVSFPYKPEHLAFGDKPVWVSPYKIDSPSAWVRRLNPIIADVEPV